jgi:hypothetical protein
VLVGLALALRPLDITGDLKFVLLALFAVTGSFGAGALAARAHASPTRTHETTTP